MVADHIKTEFKDIGANRASMIARTELSSAIEAGLQASYGQINNEAGKIVIKETILYVSPDERLCKECEGLRHHVVKNYETGEVLIEIPVHVNCRCVSSPVTV
jgi:hypothetical protein